MKKIISKYDGILAKFYDADHHWRDYKKQASLIASLYTEKKQRKKIEILDLCCGSGSHALALADRGFKVTGVDLSSALLSQARKKVREANLQVSIKRENIFSLPQRAEFLSNFDCAVLLGWTLNIHPIYRRFKELLDVVFAVLKPGGLFVFDVSLGLVSHPNSSQPFHYELSSGMKGNLRIKERTDLRKKMRFFTYDWTVFEKKSAGGRKEYHLSAKEILTIIQSEDVLKVMKKFNKKFEMAQTLRDYSLGLSRRAQDRNMVMILKKRVAQF